MADPKIPHLLGITLDGNGVANTLVVAINKSTREQLIKRTNSDKVVIFDAADFPTPYGLNIIEFNNAKKEDIFNRLRYICDQESIEYNEDEGEEGVIVVSLSLTASNNK